MIKLVLLRHGESLWNAKRLFTGWVDIDLNRRGEQEASMAGRALKRHGFTFDVAYTSVLKRAIKTLWIVLDKMDLEWVPVINAWQLNERHYGGLQGLSKVEIARQYGDDQLHIWRRSFNIKPPSFKKTYYKPHNHDEALTHVWKKTYQHRPEPLDSKSALASSHDERYKLYGLTKIPNRESLADTCRRVLPYWHKVIEPRIIKGDKIIISAHGNSLRALVKYLDNLSDADIPKLEIPTGVPLVYEFNNKGKQLKKIRSYYLK